MVRESEIAVCSFELENFWISIFAILPPLHPPISLIGLVCPYGLHLCVHRSADVTGIGQDVLFLYFILLALA